MAHPSKTSTAESTNRYRDTKAVPALILMRSPEVGDPKVADISNSPYMDALGLNPQRAYRLSEDFEQQSGATLPGWLTTQDTSAAGTPSLDFDDDAAAGTYTIAHSATDEAQNLTLYGGDQLTIPLSGNPIIQMRWKLTFSGDNFSADQRFVIGLASARNATLDSVATHAWFRVEGANLNLLWETDDNTTNDDDNDTGIDITDDGFIETRIDCTDLSAVRFYVDTGDGAGWRQVGSGDMSAGTGNLQFFAEIQKDAGAETDSFTVDYVSIISARS